MPPRQAGRDPLVRKARALAILNRRIHGASFIELEKEFNLNPRHLAHELKWLRTQNTLEDFETQIVSDILPAAVAAVKKAIENGDSALAMEIFKGSGLLLKPLEKPAPVAAPADENTLEGYFRIKRSAGSGDPVGSLPGPLKQLATVAEGTILDSPVLEDRSDDPAALETAIREASSQDSEEGADEPVDIPAKPARSRKQR